MRFGRNSKKRGSILAATMIILLVAAVVAMGLAVLCDFYIRNTARYEIYKNEFEIAEAAFAKAFAEIHFLVQYAGPNLQNEIANIQPPRYDGYVIKNFSVAIPSTNPDGSSNPGYKTVTEGPWKGLTLYTIRYRITAQVHQASNTSSRFKHPGVELSQDLELRYIPLYTFAIFYDPDLEIHNGPEMWISGRVHSNHNLYFGSDGGRLHFLDYVTAVGKILYGRHPDAPQIDSRPPWGIRPVNDTMTDGTNSIGIWDGPVGGTPIDHNHPQWPTLSQTRWKGHVFDESHNVPELPLPIPERENPHAIIERADPENDPPSLQQEKFEYKAGLKIIRDPVTGLIQGFDEDGAPVSLTYTDPHDPTKTKKVYSESTFYDHREGKWVNTIDINIANLIESGIAPANGILYVSNEGDDGAVRIINAQELPRNAYNGFTIASDDAVYVKGDFNTINKEYALIAGDAIMIQSNNWDDAHSRTGDSSVRKATETTLNAVCFQGIVPTQNADGTKHYSGGVENYFRFMENWHGVKFHFNGSLICMWESQKWRGWWRGWPVYRPPKRPWAWDPIYGGLSGPPGTPRVYEVLRRHWNIRTLGGGGS